MTRHPLITAEELTDLAEIDRLLHEANSHSLAQDGHCKSSEGHISLELGNHWDRHPDEPRKAPTVSIFSYLLGPYRDHHFDSIGQALETVRAWHHNEMHEDDPVEDPYMEIRRKRDQQWDQMCRDIDEMIRDDTEATR